jgi:hypothetical protein
MLTNAARSATVVAATACVSWVLERRHARYLMKEADGVWRRVLALESLSIPSPDDNSIMPSGLEGIITQKLDALSLNATTFAKLASAFGAVTTSVSRHRRDSSPSEKASLAGLPQGSAKDLLSGPQG